MPSAVVMIDALRIKVYELFLWPKNKCTLGKFNSEGSDESNLMYLILSLSLFATVLGREVRIIINP